MHEYYLIKEEVLKTLSDIGFVEEMENVQPDDYGSIHTVFAKGNAKVRLCWDGRDGYGFAQILDDAQWVDIESYVPESNRKEFMENIAKLCGALKKALRP